MTGRRLKHWGWGYEDQAPTATQLREAAEGIRARFGFGGEVEKPVPLEEVELRARAAEGAGAARGPVLRRALRAGLARAGEGLPGCGAGVLGASSRTRRTWSRFPRDESEIEAVLSWAEAEGAAVIPFGGGTSVVGGVEPRLGERPVVSMDLRRLDRVLEVDPVSLAARIQAGATGPRLEEQLREHGLTLRHFPQSFEYSTLGGWIATRAGGHFATLETHIDDLVESVRAITPRGTWESRRLPGSGAGPSPDRMLIGSEGILGVDRRGLGAGAAAARVQGLGGVEFGDFLAGRRRRPRDRPVRPASRQLPPPRRRRGRADRRRRRQRQPPDPRLRVRPPPRRRLDGPGAGNRPRARRHPRRARTAHADGPGPKRTEKCRSTAWRGAFLLAPYLRDTFVACGVLSETFETAITWDRFEEFHATVMETARRAVAEVSGVPADGPGAPRVSCRFTHVYPDGVAPYFTVLAPAIRGGEVEQWDEIKAAVSEALIDAGGTITHHHAVGRDHRPWYDRQRPAPFAAALPISVCIPVATTTAFPRP